MSNILDILLIIAVLFITAIGLFILVYVNDSVKTGFSGKLAPNQTANMDLARNAVKEFDYLLVFVIIAFSLGALISAVYINTHPIFFVAMFILQIIVVALSAIFSNVFWQFTQNPTLTSIANEFTYLNLIFTNLPLFTLIISSLIAIVSYSRGGRSNYAI